MKGLQLNTEEKQLLVESLLFAASCDVCSDHTPVHRKRMIELAEKVLRLTGSKSKLVNMPLPEDDPKQRRPDISKAKQHLDWEPTVALEQGLERTIAYFREAIAA